MLICQHCKKFYNLQERKPFLLSCGDILCTQCYNNQKDQVQNLQIQCPFDEKHLCPVDQQIIEPMYLIRILKNNDFFCINCDIHSQENANIYCQNQHQLICNYCWVKDANKKIVNDHTQYLNFERIFLDEAFDKMIPILKLEIDKFQQKSFNEKHQKIIQEDAQLKIEQDKRKHFDLQKLDQIVVIPFNIDKLYHNMYLEFRRLVNEQVNNLLRISNNNTLLTNKLRNEQKDVKLIYQASRDGFKAIDFHSRCDNKGPTISFVLSIFGKTFGGYTPIPWTSPQNSQMIRNDDSFLFSLTKNALYQQNQYFDCYVTHKKEQLMIFGKEAGINIQNDCNQQFNQCIMSQKQIDDQGAWIAQLGENDNIAGYSRFKVVDLEVYQVIF
ncbi:tldc domain-containing protein [Stylonychia lemnae]|uniref:Tldc domain-containing protein n=1 Tax=Stylonychia lemnae TaxID=5949 RepID=A0A078BD10_STYLE|nr:tldc domain-containing protein [Stylonychia lemnae]|eukprot:CDW91483.1 tldc domain-containing protein [Stylonychia lemnae]